MKKINKIVYLLLLTLVFSCNDATDINQEGIIYEEDGFTTLRDLKTGLNGAYAAYGPDFGGDAIYFNDIFTDNVRRGESNTGGGSTEYNFILQPNSDTPSQIWGNRYAAINRINRSLAAYDRLYEGFTADEKVEADHVKANLLSLRALCHLDLFEYFTPNYQDPAGLSVIKMDFVPLDYKEVYPRNTVSEILDFINADLNTSLALFNPDATEYVGTFYLSSVAVNFMKCKVALLRGDYPTAQTLAQSVINDSGLVLSPKTVYAAMFKDTAEGEAFFILSRLSVDNGIVSNYYFNTGPSDAIFEGSRQLYDLYQSTDVRRDVNFRNVNPSANYFPIGKYAGSADGSFINDIKLFRLSEVKLILAECKARNNNLSGAATDVKQLREVRISPAAPLPSYADLNAALTDILLERRKEFPFEGHRYLDIKRIGREINQGVNRLSTDAASFSAPVALPASDYRFTLPIPQSEVFANPTVQQNPEY